MSKQLTIKVLLVALPLSLIVCYFLVFIPYRDKKAVNDFVSTYYDYENHKSDFVIPLYASMLSSAGISENNEKGISLLDDANNKLELAILDYKAGEVIYQSLSVSEVETSPTQDPRYILASDSVSAAIAANNKIINLITESDKPESDCEKTILDLNAKAASLRDNVLRNYATGICDLALKRQSNLISLKHALLEKRKLVSQMLDILSLKRGGSLSSFIAQNNDSMKQVNNIIDKDTKEYNELTRKIDTTFARFKGLAGIPDKI